MKVISFEKSVGVVLAYKEANEFLYLFLHQHSGLMDFPKGHVEFGENEEQTLRRELKEETGITEIEIYPKARTSVFYWYKAKGKERERRIAEGRGIFIFKKVVYYVAKTKQKDVSISVEHIGHDWLYFKEAIERLFHNNSKRVLRFAQNFLKNQE